MFVKIFIMAVIGCGVMCCAQENLIKNGDFKIIKKSPPMANVVKSKGFAITDGWPSGFMVDTGSMPGNFSLQYGEKTYLTVKGNSAKGTVFYTAALFPKGSYKLCFNARGLENGSSVTARLYCYTAQNKWAGAGNIKIFTPGSEAADCIADFIVKNPKAEKFRIAFVCKGNVAIGDIKFTVSAVK